MQSDSGFVGTLRVTINNSESVKSGTFYDSNTSHVFDQSKKITKIVTTIDKNEQYIRQINFFSGEELLKRVGWTNDKIEEKNAGGRVESFEIDADEQLIGAELYNGLDSFGKKDFFLGVTWIKMKIVN